MDKRLILAGAVLVAAGLLLSLYPLYLRHPPPSSEAPPTCSPGWAAGGPYAIVTMPGDVYLVYPGNSSTVIYETSVFYMASRGWVSDVNNLTQALEALRDPGVVAEIRNATAPGVVRVALARGEGYKIFLPGPEPCNKSLAQVLPQLFPRLQGPRIEYLGEKAVPVDAPGWAYNGEPLPSFAVYDGGRLVTVLWLDPRQGLVVAERLGDTPILLVLAREPLGG